MGSYGVSGVRRVGSKEHPFIPGAPFTLQGTFRWGVGTGAIVGRSAVDLCFSTVKSIDISSIFRYNCEKGKVGRSGLKLTFIVKGSILWKSDYRT